MNGILIALLSIVGLAFAADDAYSVSDDVSCFQSNTCQTPKGCSNPCAAKGMTCCFCDVSKNYLLSTCSCCPSDYVCCPADYSTRWQGSRCCPKDSTCQDDGTCLFNKPAISAEGICGAQCRRDTYLTITVDNSFKMYVDGKLQKLQNADNWEKTDTILIPQDTKSICVAGHNSEYEAGILCSSNDGYIISNNQWKCTDSVDSIEDDWFKPYFARDYWKPAFESDFNQPGPNVRRHPVEGISKWAKYIWSNVVKGIGKQKDFGWNPDAYCCLDIDLSQNS